MRQWIAATIAVLCATAWLPYSGAGTDKTPSTEASASNSLQLRIATKLYLNDRHSAEPLSLFYEGEVYDYIGGTVEVTIFQPGEKRFTLFHPSKGLATKVSFQQIEAQLKRSQAQSRQRIQKLANENDPTSRELVRFGQFMLQPAFEEAYVPGQRRLTLQGRYLSYDIQGESFDALQRLPAGDEQRSAAVDPAVPLKQYWDWYARLNRILNPQALPPAARLVVNAKLAKYRIAPRKVQLNVLFGTKPQFRTTHAMSPQLEKSDLRRIVATRRSLGAAKFVPLATYLLETRPSP